MYTAMAISQRTADVVYSRTNRSILSTTNVSAPTAEIITPSDFFLSFETILGPDSSDPNSQYPLDPFAANTILVDVLQNDFAITSEDPSGSAALALFRGILAAPLVLFQPTWINPNFNSSSDEPQLGLPPELYVAVDLSQSFQRLTIPLWTWIVYVVVSLSIYVWCVGGLVISLFIRTPPTTPYDMIDFASRVDEEKSIAKFKADLSAGRRGTPRRKLQDTAIRISREISEDGRMQEPEIKWKIRVVGIAIGV